MISIAIVNGPNLNLLGFREPHLYGHQSLDDINTELEKFFLDKARLQFFQSNHEGQIIDHLQSLEKIDGLVINPGGYSHTSIAIRDAILAKGLLAIEVHLSNIWQRENFRQHSFFSDICIGVIGGLGPLGYRFAVEAFLNR